MKHHPELSHPKTPAQYIRLYLAGFAMGAADIVPGVSGGTMAFILGIYQNLIDAIKSFNPKAIGLALKFKVREFIAHTSLFFLIALGLGILSAVFALSNLLGTLLETQPTFIFAFFGGLILASIVAVGVKIQWGLGTLIAMLGSAVAAFIIVGLPALQDADHSLPTLFVSGMIAICAMILPGISGSFILLILGQYKYVLDAVRNLDIVTLIVVAAGAVVGIVAFSRVLSYLLHRHENITVAALVGFMIGSLRTILERASAGTAQIEDFGAGHWVLIAVLVLGGFLLVSVMDHLQGSDNPALRAIWKRERKAVQGVVD